MQKRRIVVVGGGAAGFFAAITAAEVNPAGCEVTLLEATAHLLAKVKVSGGGRCNVTHACFEPRELVKRYPRGNRELLGAFHRFQPRDTIAWFAARGVELKTESDGRMFPITDDSGTIVQCLTHAAQKAGVHIRTHCSLRDSERTADGFGLRLSNDESLTAERLLLAAGGNKASAAFSVARKGGHTIEEQVPSLFTFQIDDPRLKELSGLSVPRAVTSVRGSRLREEGPVLITHWGLSGPGILKLSAWGARELAALEYRFVLRLSWVADRSRDQVREELIATRASNPRRQVTTWNPFNVPQRLWERLVVSAGIAAATVWTSLSNQALAELSAELVDAEFAVTGKSMNKEEFVTCGGVKLSEVDFKTMQSRLCPGLYFAGEMLDLDGVTGGFNFQAAWTTAGSPATLLRKDKKSHERPASDSFSSLMSYWQLLLLVVPIFALIAIGVALRQLRWLTAEADGSLLKVVVSFLYPCLIFENVVNNAALRDPTNLALAPLVGIGITVLTIFLALQTGRAIGLTQGHGLRTFAFAVGINNYGYMTIPIVTALFPHQTLGVLLVYNVGCESAVWTVGILVLSGLSLREGWRKMVNPPVIALIVSLTANLAGLGPRLPAIFFDVVHQCAACAIPLALLLIGGTLAPYLAKPHELFQPKVTLFAWLLRLGLFPLMILLVAKYLPCTPDLKRVLVVQSAMPAGILSMVIAKHYGGQHLTAVQVAVGTTALGIFVIPLWLRLGLSWVSVL